MAQKTALVTGAAQGIGAAIAQLLAERGYEVAVAEPKGPKAGFFVRARAAGSRTRNCGKRIMRNIRWAAPGATRTSLG